MHIREGWLYPCRQVPSPNFNARPEAAELSLLVIHNISLPPEQYGGGYIEQFFCNQLDSTLHPYFQTICDLQVSSHLLIDRGGGVVQFVSFLERAWHAGESSFLGCSNCNDFSIGIELEGSDTAPFTAAQYSSLLAVTQAIMAEYPGITPDSIVGHSDIAPGRKTDPGPFFDWSSYRHALTQP